jgi:hypothetical protein
MSIQREIYNFFAESIEYESRADGSTGSILSYHNYYAITIGWLVPRKGSVFSLFESAFVLGLSALITILLGYGSCQYRNDHTPCVALPNADTSYLTLMDLCSFVIAFFAASVLNRWWNIRVHMDDLQTSGEQLVITFAGILCSEEKDARSKDERIEIRALKENLMHKIIGLLALSFRLLFNRARGTKDISDMVSRGFITQEEHDYLTEIDAKNVHICALLMNYLQESARKDLFGKELGLSQANMLLLQNAVMAIRMNADSAGLYIDVQMPYPFIQIIAAVVYLFVVQLTLVCAAYVAQGMATGTTDDVTTGVLTICLYNFVLFGLLRLYDVLSNPLGDDGADFPGDTYMHEYEKVLRSVAKNAFVLIDSRGSNVIKKMNSVASVSQI